MREERASDRSAPVTVIIPTFNRAELLREAIQSIRGQTLAPEQVIVVDDGSTDHTREVVRSSGPGVEYVWKENAGKASALNVALAHATRDCIWIFDDDDVALPAALERLYAALTADRSCDFSFGAFDWLGDGPSVQPGPRYSYSEYGSLNLAELERCTIFHPGLLVRKRCYDELGPFDETLVRAQDYDMLLRLTRRYRGARVPQVVFLQRRHSGLRGTRAQPIPQDSIVHWAAYNPTIFRGSRPVLTAEGVQEAFNESVLRGVHKAYGLHEFLPESAPAALDRAEEARITALLRRACIMAQHKLWDLAAADLEAAAQLCGQAGKVALADAEFRFLGRMLEWSRGLASFPQAERFHRAIDSFSSDTLRTHLRTALIWPLGAMLLTALRRRKAAAARIVLAAFVKAARPAAVVLLVRIKLAQGLERRRLARAGAVGRERPHAFAGPQHRMGPLG